MIEVLNQHPQPFTDDVFLANCGIWFRWLDVLGVLSFFASAESLGMLIASSASLFRFLVGIL